ncbi:MAG: SDR family oxidoreductase [Anaerolineae bacterium]|nr:SDR family oxidoreductase [Anaerolineae bacterium]
MELKGTRALVTGGSRGIGRAIALALGRAGAACVGISYLSQEEQACALAKEIEAAGARAIVLSGDMGVQEEAEEVVRRFIAEAGGIDILVNNAGTSAPGRIDTVSPAFWDYTLRVHVSGPFWCSRIAAPAMMSQKRGRILNITSIAGRRGVAGAIAYSTAKAAVVGFTRSLARELADYNILVNALSPGLIDTDFHAKTPPEMRKNNVDNRVPLHRYGSAEEVAEAALFILRSDYITGETLPVDGGLEMRVA